MTEIITDHMIEEAEKWHALFSQQSGNYHQRADFTKWYESSICHQQAYAQVAYVHDLGIDFKNIATSAENSGKWGEKAVAKNRSFWGGMWQVPVMKYAGGCAILLVMILFGVYQKTDMGSDLTTYSTTTGETRLVELPDGSLVRLGARSEINVAPFTEDLRAVYLKKGEALFTVSKDKERPFVVVSDETRIRVLGTKFNMNRADKNLKVSLLEGRVKVIQESEGDVLAFLKKHTIVDLTPAHSVTINQGQIQPVMSEDVAHMAVWTKGQLTYSNAPLGDVIADLRRYTSQELLIADRSLLTLPVTATFSTERVDDIVENLPLILPVKVRRSASGHFILSTK